MATWWEYTQNNTGGAFDTSLGKHVMIEAPDADSADRIAEENGLYFDGCDSGVDCSCCGDRWSRAWASRDTPYPYGYTKEEWEGREAWSRTFDKQWKDSKILLTIPLEGDPFWQ